MLDLAGHDIFDRQIIAIVALLLAATFLGPLSWLRALQLHRPARWLKRFARRMERKLNRKGRSAGKLVYRGIILLLFVLIIILLIAIILSLAIRMSPHGEWIEIILLTLLLPVRALLDRTTPVLRAIKSNQLQDAITLTHSFGRGQRSEWDPHSIIRAAIEYLAENIADKILCPLFWYLLFGLPGAILARTVNMLDGLIGHPSKRYIAFGWATARLNDVLLWLPSRLGGVIICLAALFVPGCKPFKGLATLITDAGKITSPNHGYMIAAAAGCLGISLGGPRHIEQTVIDDPWIGKGSAKATLLHLVRARVLYLITCLLLVILIVTALYAEEKMALLPSIPA